MSEIGHIRIAVTSNDLLQVDANFAQAKQIVFYDVSYDDAEFVDCVQFKGGAAAPYTHLTLPTIYPSEPLADAVSL